MRKNLEESLTEFLDEMLVSPYKERLEAIEKIKANFCDGCGQRQDDVVRAYGGLYCQCRNEE